MGKVHILGNGPYAKEVADQLNLSAEVKVVFLASGDDDECFPKLLAIGIANPIVKRRVIEEYLDREATENFLLAIHRQSVIGANVNCACANIGPFTSIGHNTAIGNYVCVCANVAIGHDTTIGRYSTICPGAVISGGVYIGEAVFIGTGAVIKDGIHIGGESIIGCGAVVLNDVPHGNVVAGNPAKFLRFNE